MMDADKHFHALESDAARAGGMAGRGRWRALQGRWKGSWDFLAVALIGTLALGYLAGRGSLMFETAVSETPFRDRQSFSALDWAIEDFELRFEEQYTALIRTINAQ